MAVGRVGHAQPGGFAAQRTVDSVDPFVVGWRSGPVEIEPEDDRCRKVNRDRHGQNDGQGGLWSQFLVNQAYQRAHKPNGGVGDSRVQPTNSNLLCLPVQKEVGNFFRCFRRVVALDISLPSNIVRFELEQLVCRVHGTLQASGDGDLFLYPGTEHAIGLELVDEDMSGQLPW